MMLYIIMIYGYIKDEGKVDYYLIEDD
jgi:hypothetical protein